MSQPTFKPLAILGAGSWGTALALYLARRGQHILLWSVDENEIKALTKDRENKQFLPGFPFPDSLHATASLAEALASTEDVLVAVPSVGYRQTLTLLKPLLREKMRILSVTKGLDSEHHQLLHEIAATIIGSDHPFAVLSGPSFAREVAAGLPTSVCVASKDKSFRDDVISRFNSPIFRCYPSDDIVGTEIGGVAKNVIAIATGISDGLEQGSNARSALITQGLAEIIALGTALGGKQETFIGLSGLGDLILTCSDDLSRNRRLGLTLGKGKTIADAEKEIGQAMEGKNSAALITQLASTHGIAMPICQMVNQILQGKITVKEAFAVA